VLSEDPRNTVFIISGRRRRQLGSWFGHLPELGIAAEKGWYVCVHLHAHFFHCDPICIYRTVIRSLDWSVYWSIGH
jgi:trehalose-6-phosphatase